MESQIKHIYKCSPNVSLYVLNMQCWLYVHLPMVEHWLLYLHHHEIMMTTILYVKCAISLWENRGIQIICKHTVGWRLRSNKANKQELLTRKRRSRWLEAAATMPSIYRMCRRLGVVCDSWIVGGRLQFSYSHMWVRIQINNWQRNTHRYQQPTCAWGERWV